MECYNKYASVQQASLGFPNYPDDSFFQSVGCMRSIHLGSGRTLSGLSYDNIYDDEA